jgi:pyruvate carboxylase
VKVVARAKADPADASHVAAPMPGMVATLAASPGQVVKAGDILLTIEAMKMETALRAERDGVIGEIMVKPGNQVDSKDLVLTLHPAQ